MTLIILSRIESLHQTRGDSLFVPFFFVTRGLDRHLDRVAEEAAQQVEEVKADAAQQIETVRTEVAQASSDLSGEVEALRADVDQRFEDVSSRVKARLAEERQKDQTTFDLLRTTPTRETVWEAMRRAKELGLLSQAKPPRVRVSELADLFVSVDVQEGIWTEEEGEIDLLQLRVEDLAGGVSDWIEWPADADGADVLVAVGRALQKHTGEDFDPDRLLNGLVDLLEVAMSHPDHRPAVQLCEPQWVVCDWGVSTYRRTESTHNAPHYTVGLPQLRESQGILTHVSTSKTWVDSTSWEDAYRTSRALFPKSPWDSHSQLPF